MEKKELFVKACLKGDYGKVQQLLPKINPNDRYAGFVGLNAACASNNLSVVKLLLSDSRTDVNKGGLFLLNGDNIYIGTSLHISCLKGYVDQVKVLLGHPNIEVRLEDCNKRTCLEVCKNAVVRKLIKDFKDNQREETEITAKPIKIPNLKVNVKEKDESIVVEKEEIPKEEEVAPKIIVEEPLLDESPSEKNNKIETTKPRRNSFRKKFRNTIFGSASGKKSKSKLYSLRKKLKIESNFKSNKQERTINDFLGGARPAQSSLSNNEEMVKFFDEPENPSQNEELSNKVNELSSKVEDLKLEVEARKEEIEEKSSDLKTKDSLIANLRSKLEIEKEEKMSKEAGMFKQMAEMEKKYKKKLEKIKQKLKKAEEESQAKPIQPTEEEKQPTVPRPSDEPESLDPRTILTEIEEEEVDSEEEEGEGKDTSSSSSSSSLPALTLKDKINYENKIMDLEEKYNREKKQHSTLVRELSKSRMKIFRIDDSELIRGRKIGQGAFGKVYECQWNITRSIAIKEVKLTRSNPRSEILKEFQDQVSLVHPNILRVYGYSDPPGLPGERKVRILMEKMDTDVRKYLFRSKPCLLKKFHVMRKMVDALHFMHSRNPVLLHRDIKAMNFLVSADGEAVKITDFGLMKTMQSSMTFVQSNNQQGTVSWMAPELLQRKPEYSVYSDIYALGITFYEVLFEAFPYRGILQPVIYDEVKNHNLRPDVSDKALPSIFRKLLKKMWVYFPRQRLNTAGLVKWFEKYERRVRKKYAQLRFPPDEGVEEEEM